MRKRLCGRVVVLFCLAACPAWADASQGLSDARKAYAEVDYQGTRTLAQRALGRGGNDRAATAELYLLLATAAAALGEAEEARTAFSFALAVSPELKLDKSLSPKVRAPYLEARGSLSGADGRPPLGITLQRRKQALELRLHDALHVADRIELATRPDETSDFVKQGIAAAPIRRLPMPPGSELQFFAQVLDRHGNVLFELGTEDEPQRLALVSSTQPAPLLERPSDANPAPYYWTAGALAAGGLAAGGLAAIMHLRREDAAREWNGTSCEQPGSTRGQQCAGVDDRRRTAENLTLGFGAAGGALLLGSLVAVILAPSSRQAAVAVEATPDHVMFGLRTAL